MKNLINSFFVGTKTLILILFLFFLLTTTINIINYKNKNHNSIEKINNNLLGKTFVLKRGFCFIDKTQKKYCSFLNIFNKNIPEIKKKKNKKNNSYFK